MPLRFKASTKNGDFKSVPAGTHVAVCNLIADLGLQPGSDLHPAPRHQMYLRFEVPWGLLFTSFAGFAVLRSYVDFGNRGDRR